MIRKVVEQRGMSFSGPAPVPPEQGPTGQGTVNSGLMSRQMVYDYPLTPDGSLTDAPTYQTMTETWDGMDAGPAVTEYLVQQNATPRRVEVKQPDGTRSVQLSYNNPNQFNDGLVYQDETFDAAGRRLSKSTVEWQQGQYESPRPVRTEVTDELGQMTATAFNYETGLYNQVTEVRNFGYGGTALLRKTVTEYENGANYTTRHIFNLVKTVEVYAADGTTRESRTEYEYDGQPLQDTPGVAQHDQNHNPYSPDWEQCQWEPDQNDPDCGSGYQDGYCQQVYVCRTYNSYDPATAYRGNVTQVKTYADAVNLGGAITETRRYDITGNLVTASTSCCEQTSFTYTLNTQYAHPEKQTRGAADASNWNARVTTRAEYDFNTGLATQTFDADGRGTTTDYDPHTLRPNWTFDDSTGAQTVFGYDDSAQTVSEVTYTDADVVAEHNVRYLNGRGQVRREEALGANNAWDVVQTKYDVFGRVWQQSRPYRDGQEQPRWGETTYDALGRVKSVSAPDGSLAENFYNETARPAGASSEPGQTMRMVDAWGRERWGRTDAQNRLVEVVEPYRRGSGAVVGEGAGGRMAAPGTKGGSKRRPPKDIVPLRHGTEALGLVTTYRYNTLGDLVETVQGPQHRYFRYDSLGRLTHQKLAETNATLDDSGVYVGAAGQWGDVFAYDERSNLIRRTDARGVRTHFNYQNDPLNRLQTVSYDLSGFGDTSHPVAPAAPVSYEYRERPGETTYVDVTQVRRVVAAGVSAEEYGFDSIGRTIDKTLTLVGRESYPQRTDYVPDSLDRITDVRYPAQYRTGQPSAPRKVVHHEYDAASRVSRVQVEGADYASALTYNAASQTTSLTVGSGGNQVGEAYDYDSQTGLLTGQRIERNGGGTRLLDLTYEYVRAGTTGGRTGQLTKITNHRDRNKDRGYQYDALGRLRRAIAGNQSHWVQAYDYDRWGNRTRVLQTTGTEAYVTNFYTVALGRTPSSSEMSGWANALRQAFVSGAQGQAWDGVLEEARALGDAVFNSSEYAARGRTDEQFVRDLYQAFLLREGEPEGVTEWVEFVVANGRAETIEHFSAGDELDLVASSLVPSERVSLLAVPRDGRDKVSYDYASNRITVQGWEYDAAGNQTRVQRADGSWQRMRYDAAGRMVRVTSDDGQTEWQRVTYGHDNSRLVTEESGWRTYYGWSGGAVIAEYIEAGGETSPQWAKNYIYLGARLLATQTPSGDTEHVEYHHPDRLGTRLVTNSSDTNYYEQVTLPYGVALDAESSGATNRRFTSYDRSAVTGLDYAVNRHYDPLQGRFTQVDPIEMDAVDLGDPQTLNLYSYCGNDPINATDPLGLFFGKLFRAIVKAVKWVALTVLTAVAVLVPQLIPAAAVGWAIMLGGPKTRRIIQFGGAVTSALGGGGGWLAGLSGGPGGTSVFNPNAGSGLSPGGGVISTQIFHFDGDEEILDFGDVYRINSIPAYSSRFAYLWARAGALDKWLGRNVAPDIFNDPWGGVEAASVFVPGGGVLRFGRVGRVVIGKVDDLFKPGAVRSGERVLNFPNQGSFKANWRKNAGLLRDAMQRGKPIRDASVDPATGRLLNNTGFLRAERNLLQNRGWRYNPATRMWHPPYGR